MSRRLSLLLAAVVGMMAVCVAVSLASPAQTTRSNRARAVNVAEQMLGRVVLPAGASTIAAAPPAASDLLARPDQSFLIVSQVDRHRFWTTSVSAPTVLASIAAHLPAGTRLTDRGFGGSELFATYTFPVTDPSSLGSRQLVLEALDGSAGGTILRADAEVRYIAPRPYDERVPDQARLLDITVGSNLAKPLRFVTVSDISDVRRIASVVNGLPFVGNEHGATSCPAFPSGFPVDRFVFRAAAGGPPLATVTELSATPTYDYPCGSTALTIRGQHKPPLQDGGVLLKDAGALVGVRLTR